MPYKDPEKSKETARKGSRKHYLANKEKVKAASAKRKQAFSKRWESYKSTLVCVYCGFTHHAALDFHHVIRHPSNRKVHRLLANENWGAVMEEIKKCLVLCANCHRIHHWAEKKAATEARRRKAAKSKHS